MDKVNYLVVGTNNIVSLEDNYESIGLICGLQKLDATQPLPAGSSIVPIAELTKTGILRRTRIKVGTRDLRMIYMTPTNFSKIQELVGLTYAGLTIKQAYFAGLPLGKTP